MDNKNVTLLVALCCFMGGMLFVNLITAIPGYAGWQGSPGNPSILQADKVRMGARRKYIDMMSKTFSEIDPNSDGVLTLSELHPNLDGGRVGYPRGLREYLKSYIDNYGQNGEYDYTNHDNYLQGVLRIHDALYGNQDGVITPDEMNMWNPATKKGSEE